MSEQTPNDDAPEAAAPDDAAESAPVVASTANRAWLIPAVTFLVGLALGAVVVAVTSSGGDDSPRAGDQPSGTPTTSVPAPTLTASPDVSVTVPGECIEVADDAEALLALVDDAAGAVRDLNASELGSILDEIQAAQTTLQEQVDLCQSAQDSTS